MGSIIYKQHERNRVAHKNTFLQQIKAPGFNQSPHKTGVFEPVAVTTTSAFVTASSALSKGIAPVSLANL
jgi:hypothetical protein